MRISGAFLIAATAFVPIVMSPVSLRAHDFAKLLALVPFATLAMIAMVAAVGCREIIGSGLPERRVNLGMLMFLVIALVTSLLADSPAVAFFGRLYRPEGLAAWVAFVAVFLALQCWIRWTGRGVEFLDLMLMISAIPAAYAVQQWLGLDFYVSPGSEWRATSTMGGPGLLGAYLAICLVVTVARAYSMRQEPLMCASWVVLACLQGWALWLSRARGPALAAFSGLLLLAILFAIRRQSRRLMWGIAAAVAAGVIFILSINLAGPAKQWAQATPGLNRMVFDLSREVSVETSLSTRSVVSRLGIWRAGVDVVYEASWARKLFGYGPESAQPTYFRHIPAAVMRAEDFRTVENFDRLHSDVLDMVLNFGAIGWLLYGAALSSAVYVAGQRIGGDASNGSAKAFVMLLVVLPFAFAGLVVALGLVGLVALALGLGVAAAWACYLALCAVRAGGTARNTGKAEASVSAGLAAGLVVYWIDAQLNFPLVSAHLLAFSMAALLFALSFASRQADEPDPTGIGRVDEFWMTDLGVAFATLATIGSFLSPVDRATDNTLAGLAARFAIPIAFIFGTCFVRHIALDRARRRHARWVATVVVAPALYVIVHLLARPSLAHGFEISFVDRVAAVRLITTGAALGLGMIAVVFGQSRSSSINAVPGRPRVDLAAAGVITGLLLFAVLFGTMAWRALLADVAGGSPHLVDARERYTVDELAEIAVAEAPWEWRHHSDLIYRRLGHALLDLKPDGVPAEHATNFLRELGKAELAARAASKSFSYEPWAQLALAKVLQVRGLGVLRPLMPETGPAAVVEANSLFETAHQMFPASPLVLHGWAQLCFDNGLNEAGYRLLDKMERIVPGEPEPYFERAAAAVRSGDKALLAATLERAGAALPRQELLRLQDFVQAREGGFRSR